MSKYTSEKYNRKNEELTRLQQNLAAIRERLGCTGATQEETLTKIDSIRAEAQQAFSAECGRFHNEGPQCATCGRSDRDARLAAAEKLARAVDAYLKNASSDQQFDYMQEMEDANCAFKEAAK